ncbi:hypothetical protein NL676_005095, partial [Syzygium grande]
MEKVSLSRRSRQAKIIGTVMSISVASVITLYKGLPIIFNSKPSLSLYPLEHSSNSNWVVGGILLTAEYILVTLWYILLLYYTYFHFKQIMKEYPAEMTVIFFYNGVVSFLTAIVCLVMEYNMNAWRVQGRGLASVICSGLFGQCLNNIVHTWAIRFKGPFYVAMFKPLSIRMAVAMGIFFLGDTLYLRSLYEGGLTLLLHEFGSHSDQMGVPAEFYSSSLMYDAATSKNAKMAEVIRGNEWCWPPARSDQLVCIQGALCGSFAAAKEDNATFTGSISGRFASVDPWNLDAAISKNAKLAEVIGGNEWCWPPARSDQLVGKEGALCGSFATHADKEDKVILTGSGSWEVLPLLMPGTCAPQFLILRGLYVLSNKPSLVEFLNKWSLEKMDKHIYLMTPVSPKYDIPCLLESCERRMLKNLNVSGVVDALEISDVCSTQMLKGVVLSLLSGTLMT